MSDTPGITAPKGLRACGLHCGIKADAAKADLILIVADKPASAAAVFTQNRVCAAPVNLSRKHVAGGRLRAIVANSGCANAATGKQGDRNALETANMVAEAIGAQPSEVLVCSTGPIGKQLPMDKLAAGIAQAAATLGTGPAVDEATARGIMTTDAGPKRFGVTGKVGGKTVTVSGVCKGAGMIAPNMATMLCFVTTDAAIAPAALNAALKAAVAGSFNTIRVDGHTSTNDTVAVLATGAAGNAEITQSSADFPKFAKLLDKVTLELALKIVRDGEGADKLCEIRVDGAASDAEARAIAVALADSPLWKCAMTSADANWGRIVCSAGNVMSRGGPADLVVKLGKHRVYAKGEPQKVDREALTAAMKDDPIRVTVQLSHGEGSALIRTCDINHKYIAENTERFT